MDLRSTVDVASSAADPGVLGPFTLHRLIGRGEATEVFVASETAQQGTAPPVALRVTLPDVPMTTDAQVALMEDLHWAANLKHPNILATRGYEKVNQRWYVATDLASGPSLAAVIQHLKALGQKLPEAVVAAVARQCAAALSYVHPLGPNRLHRDLSPNNLFLDASGKVSIGEFGSARAAAILLRSRNGGQPTPRFLYRSPEVLSGKQVDGRADIFSLGAVLWELVALKPAHPSLQPQAIIQSFKSGFPPDVRRENPACSPALADLIHAMLQPDFNKRPTAAEVLRRVSALPGGGALVSVPAGLLPSAGQPARPSAPAAPMPAPAAAAPKSSAFELATEPEAEAQVAPAPGAQVTSVSEWASNKQTQAMGGAGGKPKRSSAFDLVSTEELKEMEQESAATQNLLSDLPPERPKSLPPTPQKRRFPVGIKGAIGIAAVLLLSIGAARFAGLVGTAWTPQGGKAGGKKKPSLKELSGGAGGGGVAATGEGGEAGEGGEGVVYENFRYGDALLEPDESNPKQFVVVHKSSDGARRHAVDLEAIGLGDVADRKALAIAFDKKMPTKLVVKDRASGKTAYVDPVRLGYPEGVDADYINVEAKNKKTMGALSDFMKSMDPNAKKEGEEESAQPSGEGEAAPQPQ